jgi:DNA end-binding protein Ku
MWPDNKAGADHSTHAVDILAFVDAQQMPARYFDVSYQLAPAPGGERVYAMLRETLRSGSKIGIAHVLIGPRQHLAALVPRGDLLMLHTLCWEGEFAHGTGSAAHGLDGLLTDETGTGTDMEAALDALASTHEELCDKDDADEDFAFCADVLADDMMEDDQEEEALDRALASVLDLRLHAGSSAVRRRRTGHRPRSGWLRPRSRLLS